MHFLHSEKKPQQTSVQRVNADYETGVFDGEDAREFTVTVSVVGLYLLAWRVCFV
jgi:hypothetical protein